jgi:hypothetical protein
MFQCFRAGGLFGGWLSDRLFALYGDAARIGCAQVSVLSGFPTIYITLMLLPREPSAYWFYCISLLLFGFGASWCTPACNRPVITEIVQPEIRGSIIGFWIGIETVVSAFSAPAAVRAMLHWLSCLLLLLDALPSRISSAIYYSDDNQNQELLPAYPIKPSAEIGVRCEGRRTSPKTCLVTSVPRRP